MSAFAFAYAAWLLSELLIFRRDRPLVGSEARDSGSRNVIVWTMISSLVAAFGLAALHLAPTPWPRKPAVPVGPALMLLGIALRLWSVRTLGAHFRTEVTLLDGHRLIRSGPYRWLRHPAYTGGLLTCLGLGISLADWLALAVMLAGPITAYALRMRVEERALGERFGDEWRRYRADRWAVIPPIW